MYNDYKTKAQNPVCYETYRSQVAKMNISFVNLGEDECEVCTQCNQVHEHSDNEITNWNEHIEKAASQEDIIVLIRKSHVRVQLLISQLIYKK